MAGAPPHRVAIIGYGYAGKTFHAPLIRATSGLELTLIASSDPGKVTRDHPEVRVGTLDEALACNDVDLVVIATPTASHFEIAERGLLAGKHVVVDKPLALNLREAERLVELASQRRRLLTVFHNRRWDGDFLFLRDLVSRNTLGQVMLFESRFDRYRPVVRDRWRERPGPGSGLWLDLGPHLVDQALLLFGMPLAVHGDLACQREGAVAVDYFHVVLRYETLRVVLASSSVAAEPGRRFRLLGTDASYEVSGVDPQEAWLASGGPAGSSAIQASDPGILTVVRDGRAERTAAPMLAGDYIAYYRAVRDALDGTGASPVSSAEILAVTRIMDLAVLSTDQRREIPIH